MCVCVRACVYVYVWVWVWVYGVYTCLSLHGDVKCQVAFSDFVCVCAI